MNELNNTPNGLLKQKVAHPEAKGRLSKTIKSLPPNLPTQKPQTVRYSEGNGARPAVRGDGGANTSVARGNGGANTSVDLRQRTIDVSQDSRGGHAPAPVPAMTEAQAAAASQWQELKEQAILGFESGLLPRAIDSRQKAITIALMGRELGLSPMQSLCGIYVVNGMAALRGSLMLRLIYERVPGAKITVLTPPDRQNQECSVEMQRPNGKPHVFRFTLDDARKASFMNKPIWQQHTATMLRWSAIRTGARVVFADAIAGCYMEDELPANHSHQEKMEQPDIAVVPHATETSSTFSAPEPEPVETIKAQPVAAAPTPAPAARTVEKTVEAQPEAPAPKILVRDLPLEKKVTEKQVHRLYAIAHEKRWSRQDVGIWMEKWFKKREAKDLNRMEYDKLCNFLLSSQAKSQGLEPAASN